MNRNALYFFIAVLIIGSMLAGCGAPSTPTAAVVSTEAQPSTPPIKIAILLSTTASDSGWDATAVQGGEDAKTQLGAEVSVSENVTTSGTEAVVRDYASRGYNLIIANDFSMGEGVNKVAPEFPNTKFVITTGIWEAANVSSFNPNPEDYFLGGCLDALMSKSGKIGIMGGMNQPAMVATANAIAEGARLCRPDIGITIAYVGSWADPAKAKELALGFIASGIDVIDGSVSVGYDGILSAIKEAEANGQFVYTITDQVMKPDFIKQIMAAHTQDHGPMVLDYAKQVIDGTFHGVNYRPGLSTGLIYLKMTETVPADIQAKVQQVQQDIVDGKTTVVPNYEEVTW